LQHNGRLSRGPHAYPGANAAARGGALLARPTGADPSGAAALRAWAQRRPWRARGGRGRASRRGSAPCAGRPRAPVRPASGHGVCRRPRQRGCAWRRAPPARGSPWVGLGRRRRGGQQGLCRPGAGPAGPHATPRALAWAPLACGSRQPPPTAAAARPAAEGRGPPRGGPLSPGRASRGPAPLCGRPWVDGAGHPPAVRGGDGGRAAPGVSGTPSHRGPGLSLAQASCCPQARVAGETRTDCGLGQAHGGGGAGGGGHPTAGPPVSPRPCAARPRE